MNDENHRVNKVVLLISDDGEPLGQKTGICFSSFRWPPHIRLHYSWILILLVLNTDNYFVIFVPVLSKINIHEVGKAEQIDYWINTANDDLQTAELLISNRKFLHGLFFGHLCIEKAIKAHIVRFTGQIPPKSHNLLYLSSKTDLSLSEEQKDLCSLLMSYQLEGRYPEYYPSAPTLQEATDLLLRTKELFTCLKEKL